MSSYWNELKQELKQEVKDGIRGYFGPLTVMVRIMRNKDKPLRYFLRDLLVGAFAFGFATAVVLRDAHSSWWYAIGVAVSAGFLLLAFVVHRIRKPKQTDAISIK